MKPTFAQALAELVSNRTVWVPVLIWFVVQLWKVISSLIEKGNPRLCRGDLKSLTVPGVA